MEDHLPKPPARSVTTKAAVPLPPTEEFSDSGPWFRGGAPGIIGEW